MGPPKISGAMNKKIHKQVLEDNDKLSKQMKLFLSKSLEDNINTSKTELSNDLPAINSLDPEDFQDQEDHVDFSINVENYLSKQTSTNQDNDSDFINSIPSSSSDKIKIALFSDQLQLNLLESNDFVNIDNNLENIVQKLLHFNDPSSWPFMNDKIRTLLIEHGPEQGKNSDFSNSENFEQRKFFSKLVF